MSDPIANAAHPSRREIDLPSALQAFRKRKRKVAAAKAEAGEIKFLNIVAMVDVLTILLIFLLKSVSVSSTTAPTGANLNLPFSSTQKPPLDAVKVVIARDRLLVEDTEVAPINKGAVPDLELAPGNPLLIPDLEDALERWIRLAIVSREGGEQQLNVAVVADRDTPYQVLFQVCYTIGQSAVDIGDKTFGFDKYRLMAMRAAE